ncbi:MAG: polysaccharide deacetylase family protein [Desulfovibrio sp.]|nr:polysaccharide deacetylase family protein [Desulfovibrio sp.]
MLNVLPKFLEFDQSHRNIAYPKLRAALTTLLCALLIAVNSQARVIGGDEMMNQDMEENLCALTFDDGPSIFTPELLDMLKEHNIHATFFMLGQMVNHYQDIAIRVAEEGHEIASHTYSHKNLKRLSNDGQLAEITKGFESLQNLGIIPRYMRPPYGSYDERTVEIAKKFGLDVVLWSMDSRDWKRLPDDYRLLRSVRGTPYEPGTMRGVFLFHDIHKKTVDDLPRIIQQLREAGCQRFVTFSEYMQGLADPEPPILMTRRPVAKEAPEQHINQAALSNPTEPEVHNVSTPAQATPEEQTEQPLALPEAQLPPAESPTQESVEQPTHI